MNDKRRRALILLPWLSLPVVVVSFLVLWERVPERLAVHFDSSGAANGWMSRWQFLAFSVGVLVFLIANFSWKLLSGRDDGNVLLRMIYYYAGTIIVTGVLLAVLKYNL